MTNISSSFISSMAEAQLKKPEDVNQVTQEQTEQNLPQENKSDIQKETVPKLDHEPKDSGFGTVSPEMVGI